MDERPTSSDPQGGSAANRLHPAVAEGLALFGVLVAILSAYFALFVVALLVTP